MHLPVWTLQWSFIWCLNLNAFPQNSHLKGLSPVWTGKCAINVDTSGKLLPQNLHKTTFPGSTGPISKSIGDSSVCIVIYAGSLYCPIIGNPIGLANIVSRYFSVSSVCVVKICLVSLLWWGNAAPQCMQRKPLSPSSTRPLPDPSYSCNHKKEHQLLFSLVPVSHGPNCVCIISIATFLNWDAFSKYFSFLLSKEEVDAHFRPKIVQEWPGNRLRVMPCCLATRVHQSIIRTVK